MSDQKWNGKTIDITDGYCYAAFTDCIKICKWPLDETEKAAFENRIGLLLEIRIFDLSKEYRWIRSDISKDFKYRNKCDQENKLLAYYDEYHYVDIDENATLKLLESDSMKVVSIGGGTFEYPLKEWKHSKVKIRNYVSYTDNGQAYVNDWRLVGFTDFEGKEVK